MRTISISELNERKKEADRAISLAADLDGKALSEIIQAAGGDQCPNEIRSVVYNASMNLKHIIEQLRRYSYLLDDVARSSEISWPPVCLQAGKEDR